MGSPKKVRVRARTRDSFRLPPSSGPQTSSTNKMAKGSGSKKAKKSGSNVFALFSQRQIQEFKEAFGIMDADKDGLLSSGDIVAAFNSVGKSVSDGEAQGMLSEAPGPVNFTQMVMLFAEKMAGGADDDDTILKAFDAFEVNGKIDADIFKRWLEVLMMTTPSLRLSMPSKSTAKSTQTCSNTPLCPSVTNSPLPK